MEDQWQRIGFGHQCVRWDTGAEQIVGICSQIVYLIPCKLDRVHRKLINHYICITHTSREALGNVIKLSSDMTMWGPILHRPKRVRYSKTCRSPTNNFSSPNHQGSLKGRKRYAGQHRNTFRSIELAHCYCEFQRQPFWFYANYMGINSHHSSFYLICRSQISTHRFVSVLLAPSNFEIVTKFRSRPIMAAMMG